jgi:hypothetical protein
VWFVSAPSDALDSLDVGEPGAGIEEEKFEADMTWQNW